MRTLQNHLHKLLITNNCWHWCAPYPLHWFPSFTNNFSHFLGVSLNPYIFLFTFYSKTGKNEVFVGNRCFMRCLMKYVGNVTCLENSGARTTWTVGLFFLFFLHSCPNAIVNRNYSLLPGKCLAISPRKENYYLHIGDWRIGSQVLLNNRRQSEVAIMCIDLKDSENFPTSSLTGMCSPRKILCTTRTFSVLLHIVVGLRMRTRVPSWPHVFREMSMKNIVMTYPLCFHFIWHIYSSKSVYKLRIFLGFNPTVPLLEFCQKGSA